MGYQMGYEGVMGFTRMIEAIEHSEWDQVKAEALDSQWARQTPARADLVSSRIAYGAGA
jgi:lysozyme